MKKYIAEFIGTFFLVLVVVMAANNGIGVMAPLAIGSMLTVMVFAVGHISGAHLNPAVSLAVMMRGKLSRQDFPYYILAQVLGGVLAALLGAFLLRGSGIAMADIRVHDVLPALLSEFFGTFALAFVVLNVATTRANAGNSHYGLAIGFTVMSVAYALGGISGGAFNPAVAVGISVAGMVNWNEIWIFLVGDFLGAAAAITVFQVVYGIVD